MDLEADVSSYSIERSVDPVGPYMTVGTVPKPTNGPNVIKYDDYSALPSTNRYYYRIAANNSCGFQDTVSNISSSILLEVAEKGNLTNTLVWNKYEKFGGYIERYRLYRQVDDNPGWTLVTDQLTENDTVFEDDIRDFANGQGKILLLYRSR